MFVLPRRESLGETIGSGLGTLAGLKLGQLVSKHQQQAERANFAKTWEPILGKNTANFLSNLSPDERKNALQDVSSLIQLNEAPSSREQVAGMAGLSQQQPQQQMPDQQQQLLKSIQDRFTNQTVGQRPQEQQGSLLSGLAGTQAPQQFGQQQPQEQGQQPQQITPERAKLIENLFKTPEQKAAAQKMEIEKKKEARAEKRAGLQEKQFNIEATKTYVDELKNKEKAAKDNNLRLKRMENLIDKGNLPNAGLWSFLTKIEDLGPLGAGAAGAVLGHIVPGIGNIAGGIIGGLSSPLAGAAKSFLKSGSPDIEEFEKLSTEFVKNAKQYFGARVTEGEIKLFMNTVPTLMQTDAGKKKVIDNIRSLNELTEIEAKAARSIIRENNGIPPIDIEQQVKDKISKKIDKVAKKFIG